MTLAELKNKVTKELEKLDLKKIKNETTKHGLKAATTVLNFGTKVVKKVGGKFQEKETEKVSKDKKQRKKINRIRKF